MLPAKNRLYTELFHHALSPFATEKTALVSALPYRTAVMKRKRNRKELEFEVVEIPTRRSPEEKQVVVDILAEWILNDILKEIEERKAEAKGK